MYPMFVALLEEGNVLSSLSFDVRTHTGHAQSKLTRVVEVSLEEVVEHLHVSLLAKQYVIGQILQHLGEKGESPAYAVGDFPLRDEPVALRGDDGGIDETQENSTVDRIQGRLGTMRHHHLQCNHMTVT